MLGVLKSNAIYIFFVVGIILGLRSLAGRPQELLMLIAALIPLRNVVDRMQSLPMGKDFIDIALFLTIVGWFIFSMSRKQKFISPSPLNGICIAMMIYTLMSLLMGSSFLGTTPFSSADPRTQVWKNYCILPLLYFLSMNTLKDDKMIWRMILVIMAVNVLSNMYLLRQFAWYSSLVSRKKISGTFEHLGPNEVAAYYNMYTMIFMSLFFVAKKKLHKMALMGLVGWNLFCILFLFSRAAYMATTLGMAIIFGKRKPILIMPLIIIGLFWQVALPQKVRDRISGTTNEYGELDESSAERIHMWKLSLEMFAESPLFGKGFGVFPYMGFVLGDTHNIYLKILAEQGGIGLFIFLILIAIMFFQGARLAAIEDDERKKAMGFGFAVAIVVLAVNNVFGDRWTYMEVSSNLWIFAGIVSHWRLQAEERYKVKMKKAKEELKRQRDARFKTAY